jgi:DNA-binding MarR family transcriptional regulator
MAQITETVGFAIALCCKAHRGATDAALREIGLHVGQEMILLQLWCMEGMTQTQLAERLGVEPPTVTKMLQRIEQDGIIERRPDPEDARVSRVFLTERGRALESEVERTWRFVEARAVAGLTDEERLLLRRLLMHVRANLSTESS